jgi:O-acetyl-ADP-ribose deacetylase (regulator of RNase III)
MLYYLEGDLFESPAKVLVNAVNTVGIMGKGIAQEFKAIYPEMFKQYQRYCEDGSFTIGKLWLYKTPNKWVLNFPTKEHWRRPSEAEYIEKGLKKFVAVYAAQGIPSIAFPRIGCGHGELDWATTVEPLINKYLRKLPIDVFVYSKTGPILAEHRDIEATKAWLRAEPQSLSFQQVWDDLSEPGKALRRARSTQGEEFQYQTSDDDIRILPGAPDSNPWKSLLDLVRNTMATWGLKALSKGEISIPKEVLVDLWQSLRVAGFLEPRTMANGLDGLAPYLYPILLTLPYIRPVHLVAGSESGRPVTALRLHPQAFPRESSAAPEETLQRA